MLEVLGVKGGELKSIITCHVSGFKSGRYQKKLLQYSNTARVHKSKEGAD